MPTIAEMEAQVETLSRRLEETEQELSKAKRLAQQAEIRAVQAEGSAEKAIVESHIRAAAIAAGSTLEPTEGSKTGPLEDVVRAAMSQARWKTNSEGKVFLEGDDGKPVMTTEGHSTPLDWMQSYRQKWHRLFPKHQGDAGTGSTTGAGVPAGDVNYWSPERWDTTEQGYVIRDHGMAAAKAMADAEGVDVYATKPRAR
jgi:hypothetical protein